MLKAGKPTTAKERAIQAMKEEEVELEKKDKGKVKRFNADIPEELHRAIKSHAANQGLALNELATIIFSEYMSKISKSSKE